MGIGLTRLQACNIVHLRFYRPKSGVGKPCQGREGFETGVKVGTRSRPEEDFKCEELRY